MSTLVEFLKARLDEQEARARALPPGPWRWVDDDGGDRVALVGSDGNEVLASVDSFTCQSWITKHDAFDAYLPDVDPARVLREVEAKRQIFTDHTPEEWAATEYCCSVCQSDRSDIAECDNPDPWPCRTVRRVAAVYDDHPDYQKEWAP